MWRLLLVVMVAIGIGIFGLSLSGAEELEGDVSANLDISLPDLPNFGFQEATDSYDFEFPEDFAPHTEYLSEWWRYMGVLQNDAGREFGYQLIIFRRAFLPNALESESEWRTNQVFVGQLALTDVENDEYYFDQRISRAGANLANAESTPYRIWIDNWEVMETSDGFRLRTVTTDFSLVLTLEKFDTPVFENNPQKNLQSHRYAIPSLATQGTVILQGENYTVSGNSWIEQEFGTTILPDDAEGWNKFRLYFDDGRNLYLEQIFGEAETHILAWLEDENGTVINVLDDGAISIENTETWASSSTNINYPVGWTIEIELSSSEVVRFDVAPNLRSQEFLGFLAQWSGIVEISGDITGQGYIELSGYRNLINMPAN